MRSGVWTGGSNAGTWLWDEAMCGADARLSAADPSSSLVMSSSTGGRGIDDDAGFLSETVYWIFSFRRVDVG